MGGYRDKDQWPGGAVCGQGSRAQSEHARGPRVPPDSLQAEPWVEVVGADLAESPSSWPGACFQGL